jgi:hypothetical protein
MSEQYQERECKWRPLAEPVPGRRPGERLAEQDEPGQSFGEHPDTELVSHLGNKQQAEIRCVRQLCNEL